MPSSNVYRSLTDQEVETLAATGCSSADWSAVEVAEGFDPARVRKARFSGTVKLGANAATGTTTSGVDKPCGIYSAQLHNTTVGDNVRIANVDVHIANYDIGDEVVIENVGTVETNPGSTFGNGVEIEPLNEGGGREVVIFNRLDSQFAHLVCVHRYPEKFVKCLQAIADAEVAAVKSDRGAIGAGTRVVSVKLVIDTNLGEAVTVDGATSLVNGTVLSTAEAPTLIGVGVQCSDFIVAEGTKITSGALVNKAYIGQGCQIGKQYSAEGSVFFANCEGFHGEACSVFAGPYTVTHHKASLLIAGLFSFYNAGSGTNQSNHLYKLGPLHEGKLERGCKTGSFSYMMWPCRVGPFSVVLGKHKGTFDTTDFPFSYLDASAEGKCVLTPGFNFTTVGVVRDGAKWPARDRRKGAVKRDRLTFDVFSPLTVGRMLRGSAIMKQLQETTDKAVDSVTINGAEMKRVLLRSGQKNYRNATQMYLLEKVVGRAEAKLAAGATTLAGALAADGDAVFSEQWVDVGGQMMPRQRLDELCTAIESGKITDLGAISAGFDAILAAYGEDEWAWVRWAFEQVYGKSVDSLTGADVAKLADDWLAARTRFIQLVLNDAKKEFDSVNRTGYGYDGGPEDAIEDFKVVRGEYETNGFVKQMNEEIAALGDRVEKIKQAAAAL